jgi:hypothetical protein
MDTKTPRQHDIDERLRSTVGVGLIEWVGQQRDKPRSWRSISLQLWRITGDSVADETLRNWHREWTEREPAA